MQSFRRVSALFRVMRARAVRSATSTLRGVDASVLLWVHALTSGAAALALFPALRAALEALFEAGRVDAATGRLRYFSWIQPYYFPNHKFLILSFVVTAVILGVVVVSLARTSNAAQSDGASVSKTIVSGAIAVNLLALFALCARVVGLSISPLELLVLTSVLFGSIAATHFRSVPAILKQSRVRLLGLAGAVAAAQLVSILLYLASGRFPLVSDYLQLPHSLSVTAADRTTRTVDTIDYVNAERLWGNHLLPDMRRWQRSDPPCLEGNEFQLPRSVALAGLIKARQDTFYFHNAKGTLCFVGLLDSATVTRLIEIAPEAREHINSVFVQNVAAHRKVFETAFSREAEDFGRKNKVLFINFIHDLEQSLHHHFQYLNPIKELELGKPLREINAPYGLNFVAVRWLMKLFGGVSFTTYVQVMFASMLLYVLAQLLIINHLYRSVAAVVSILFVSTGCIVGLGMTTLSSGLGYGPMRHALDLGVLLLLVKYLRGNDLRLLMVAIALALANAVLDRFVGAFCPVALAAMLVLRGVAGQGPTPRIELGLGSALFVAVPVLYVLLGGLVAPNPYGEQFLDGVWGFPVGTASILALVLLAFSLVMATLRSIQLAPVGSKWIVIYMSAYMVIFMLYWLAVPNYGHLYKLLPVATLAIALFLLECVKAPVRTRGVRAAEAALLAIPLLFWLSASRNFLSTAADVRRHVSASTVHTWTFDRWKGPSTIAPQAIEDAVKLIKSTTPPGKPVAILSEHDALLLFLSDRISAMRHFEVPTFLNSPKNMTDIVEGIRRDRPAQLIVDSCITCSAVPFRLTRQIPHLHPSYLDRSLGKVDRLQKLREVFAAVAEDYEPVPELGSALISVYRRKASSQ